MFNLTFTNKDYTNLINNRGNFAVYEIFQMYGAKYYPPVSTFDPISVVSVQEPYITFDSEDNMLLFALKYM